MDREDVENLAYGEIDAIQQKLWNPAATWPTNFQDQKQNPLGRPIDYWCPMINGQTVGWKGVSGWPTKSTALDIARKFQQKCIEWLAGNID